MSEFSYSEMASEVIVLNSSIKVWDRDKAPKVTDTDPPPPSANSDC